jgi:hypothetical protein
VLTLTGICGGRRPWLFRLGILLLVGDYPSRELVLYREVLVGWLSESWSQKCWGRFGWRPPWLGRRALPLLNYILASALELRKSNENFSQGSQEATGLLVAPTWLSCEGQPRLACWKSVELGYPVDSSQPSTGTGAFRVAGLRGSPHQLTSSRNSMLSGGQRRTESPNHREYACYQRPKLCQSRCEDTWIVRPAAFGHGSGQRTSRSDICNPT